MIPVARVIYKKNSKPLFQKPKNSKLNLKKKIVMPSVRRGRQYVVNSSKKGRIRVI